MREAQRKLNAQAQAIAAGGTPDKAPSGVTALRTLKSALKSLLERAERIRTQQRKDKNKLYALHAPGSNALAKARRASPTNLA